MRSSASSRWKYSASMAEQSSLARSAEQVPPRPRGFGLRIHDGHLPPFRRYTTARRARSDREDVAPGCEGRSTDTPSAAASCLRCVIARAARPRNTEGRAPGRRRGRLPGSVRSSAEEGHHLAAVSGQWRLPDALQEKKHGRLPLLQQNVTRDPVRVIPHIVDDRLLELLHQTIERFIGALFRWPCSSPLEKSHERPEAARIPVPPAQRPSGASREDERTRGSDRHTNAPRFYQRHPWVLK